MATFTDINITRLVINKCAAICCRHEYSYRAIALCDSATKILKKVKNILTRSVASERNQHCGGEARPERPKLETRRAEPGWSSSS